MRAIKAVLNICLAAVTSASLATAAYAGRSTDEDLLTPSPSIGDQFSDVFSIATSVKAAGFDEIVRRNSGSADLTLTSRSKDGSFVFDLRGRYDGAPVTHGQNIFRDGGGTQCWLDKCQTATDASGLLYNRLLWGTPPRHLKAGATWQVKIPIAWELGPAGVQTVTVVHVDRSNGTIVLKREGDAVGAFANEKPTLSLSHNGKSTTFAVVPGRSHWRGFTTFRHGVIIADELLVDHKEELRSDQGLAIPALVRRYMLLNSAPYPTLTD